MAEYTLPTCPTTTPRWNPTCRPRSWSCTTTSTMPPTWPGPTRRSRSWPGHAARTLRRHRGARETLAFHISGHVLHSIFWKNQSPDGGDKPDGALGSAIDENFGSFDKFKAQFTQATSTIQGSGWGVLAYEPLAGRLIVEQVYDHQSSIGRAPSRSSSSTPGSRFYLQYKNVKADFFAALWNVVNWPDVGGRLDAAKKLTIPG